MEFMYCIPDLELFIDKTIKKCLLEYDLDANDTEAVLDDMEKAWPKTPPKESDTRDHNGNTEAGRGSRPGTAGLNGAAESSTPTRSRLMGAPQNATESSSGSEKSSRPQDADDRGQGSTNGRKAADGDSDRSGCSSPDGGDGKIPVHKPTKLKSRLQQRYFEANQKIEKERSQSPVESVAQSYTPKSQAQSYTPERQAQSYAPERQAQSYTPERQAQSYTSERRAQSYTSERQAQTYTPERQAQTYTPVCQAQTYTPVCQAQTYTPERQAQTYTPEHQAQTYTQEHHSGYRPSNLDILASAVNLHTRREEENRLNALKNQHARRQSGEFVTNDTGPETRQKGDIKTVGHMPSQNQSSSLSFNLLPQDRLHKHLLQNTLTEKQLSHREHHANGANMLYTNTNNSPYKETVVVRREISRDIKNPSSTILKNPPSTSYLVLPNNSPSSMEHEQRYYPETSRYSVIPNAATSNHTPEVPKAFPQHFQDHGSRIARIIAEELQKDEECPHRSALLKNAPLVQRINPDEMKPITFINPPLPESNTLNHSQYFHNNERANNSSYLTRVSGSSHPQHKDNSFSIYTNKNNRNEDNQPQDLSFKSKENSQHISDRRHLTSLLSGPTTPIHRQLTKGYFSSPNSPIVSRSPSNNVEATPQRKSASPTVSTNSRVHGLTESSYQHRATGHWDRKEQVLRKNPVDLNLLRDMQRSEALQNWSGARHSELEKRRGNNT